MLLYTPFSSYRTRNEIFLAQEALILITHTQIRACQRGNKGFVFYFIISPWIST
jgi:hypothetical protein